MHSYYKPHLKNSFPLSFAKCKESYSGRCSHLQLASGISHFRSECLFFLGFILQKHEAHVMRLNKSYWIFRSNQWAWWDYNWHVYCQDILDKDYNKEWIKYLSMRNRKINPFIPQGILSSSYQGFLKMKLNKIE